MEKYNYMEYPNGINGISIVKDKRICAEPTGFPEQLCKKSYMKK